MAKALEFHISANRLLVGVLLTIAPISLVALYASTQVGGEAERQVGGKFQALAESTAARLREMIRSKVIHTALAAADSGLRRAAEESNRRYDGFSDERITETAQTMDALWASPAGAKAAAELLASDASKTLRRQLAVDPSFLRMTATDRHGFVVAASHKPLDFYQADESYWQEISVGGRGRVSVTDILYDDATHSYYIGVGVPVMSDDDRMIGTLDALVDVSAFFPLLYETGIGATGLARLVKSDGTIIGGTDAAALADNMRSIDYAAILDAGERFRNQGAGFMTASFPGGRQKIVAFADTGLRQEFRGLDWIVVLSADMSNVVGAVSGAQMMIMAIALISLACVVFLVVYMALHRQSEIEEFEEAMTKPAGTA